MSGKKLLNVVSIFSGGGGIDVGFKKAGYEILYSTDNSEIACDTLSRNFPNAIIECKDCRDVDFTTLKERLKIREVDVLVGGPPCPAYSKSRFYLKDKQRALKDENSFTLYTYLEALDEIRPKVYFFENVFGFIYKPHKDAFDLLVSESKRLGYTISYQVIMCADYGVPQIRQRFICVGVRNDISQKKFLFPNPTHYNPENDKITNVLLKPWVTCGEAIGDLDYALPEDESMLAGSKHHDLLKLIPPGENYLYFTKEKGYPNPKFRWRSRYWSFLLKLSPDKPSWTIQASHSNNMGPFHWKNRYLRISEIKRIQTFDDSYNFSGSYREQWRQIGNAVPPLLAEILANAIRDQYFVL